MGRTAFRLVLGIACATLVVWLGFRTATDHPQPLVVAAFGIVAALLGPFAIETLRDLLNLRRDRALERLAKAGDLELRIQQADTMEKRLAALREAEKNVSLVVKFEVSRQILLDRKEALESELASLADRVDQIALELGEIHHESEVLGQEINSSPVQAELDALSQRLRRTRLGTGRQATKWLNSIPGTFLMPAGSVIRHWVDRLLDALEDRNLRKLGRTIVHAETGPTYADTAPGPELGSMTKLKPESTPQAGPRTELAPPVTHAPEPLPTIEPVPESESQAARQSEPLHRGPTLSSES